MYSVLHGLVHDRVICAEGLHFSCCIEKSKFVWYSLHVEVLANGEKCVWQYHVWLNHEGQYLVCA